MNTTTMPKIGQKVIPLPADDGNWYGIPDYYHDKVGTVRSFATDSNGLYATAEFQSLQKPDDTVSYSFYNWKPAESDDDITFDTRDRLIGRTIRVQYSGSTAVHKGELHVVTSTFPGREDNNVPKIDGITVGVTVEDYGTAWVQAYDLIKDGDTLTVSGTEFNVGDYVEFSAVLDDTGVNESISGKGVVIESSNGVYTVQTGRSRAYVTGTGYVGRCETTENRIGEKVTMWTQDGSVPSSLLGKEGIITGWYEGLDSPIVTFPRVEQQYGGHFPGAWVVGAQYLVEPTLDDVEVPAEEPRDVALLREHIARLEATVTRLQISANNWQSDFDTLATAVLQEAVDRDWCDEYERVMSRISSSLKVGTLPEREEEYEVEVEVTGSVSTTTTVTVTARSQDDAETLVSENMDDYVDADEILKDAARYNGFDNIETEVN